jgi:hypothetical protein
LQDIAVSAQCAFSYTGEVPQTLADIQAAFARRNDAIDDCAAASPSPPANGISYAAGGPQHIELCAEFRRATPAHWRTPLRRSAFPEFAETRTAAGRHCYRIRLVSLTGDSAPE